MPLRHKDAPFLSQFPNLKLLRQDGSTVPVAEAFVGKKYVLIYFSAHWCPPCQRFTPLLADFYDTHKDTYEFEVLFVSSDREEGRMMDFFQNRSSNYVRRPPPVESLPAASDGNGSTAAAAAAAHSSSTAVGDCPLMGCDISSGSKNTTPSSSPVVGASVAPRPFPGNTLTARTREPRSAIGGPRIPKASGHGNWLALPFKENEVARFLASAYSVVSIPKLVVVATDTSCMVTREGKVMVMKDPNASGFPWRFAEGAMVKRSEGRRECVVLLLLLLIGLYYFWGFY